MCRIKCMNCMSYTNRVWFAKFLSLVLYITFPLILEVWARELQSILTINYLLVSVLITGIHFVPFISLPEYKKIWIWYYFLLFYVPTLMDVFHIYFFTGSIDLLALKVVFDSNLSESLEFIKNFSNIFSVSLLLVLVGCYILLLVKALKTKLNQARNFWLFPVFVVGIIASCFVHDKYKPTFVRIVRAYIYYQQQKDFVLDCIKQRKDFSYGPISSLIVDEPQTYVIVIGESANKEHMSLYGYNRVTTPKFDNLKGLYAFDQVTSAHCQTLEVLQEALTFDNFSQGDVISFFQAAGFKTFWLSNQFNGGRWDNIIAIVGNQADVHYFINQRDTQSTHGLCYDELLIEPFKQALNDSASKKVVFVHLLGSHSIYANRYPKEFNIFRNYASDVQKIVCEYDNSIAYTDYILHKFVSLLKATNVNSYLLYLSDHGEDVRDAPDCCFYHSPSIALPSMFSVPFCVWVSDKYTKINAEFIEQWDLHKPYKTNKLIHSILRLSRLQNHKIDSKYSVFN